MNSRISTSRSATVARLCRWIVLLLVGAAAVCPGEFLPAIAIEETRPADPKSYVALVGQVNDAMRTRHRVPLFLRSYEATSHTGGTPATFVLSPAGSFEALLANGRTFATDPELADLREQLSQAGRSGPSIYLKAVRFDGTSSPGWLFNTRVKTNDEPTLLARIAALATLLTAPEHPAPRINVFRVVAGRTDFTHLVSVNTASSEELAMRLDAIVAGSWTAEFCGPSGSRCEVVQCGLFREVLP